MSCGHPTGSPSIRVEGWYIIEYCITFTWGLGLIMSRTCRPAPRCACYTRCLGDVSPTKSAPRRRGTGLIHCYSLDHIARPIKCPKWMSIKRHSPFHRWSPRCRRLIATLNCLCRVISAIWIVILVLIAVYKKNNRIFFKTYTLFELGKLKLHCICITNLWYCTARTCTSYWRVTCIVRSLARRSWLNANKQVRIVCLTNHSHDMW